MSALRRATVLCLALAPLHAALAQGGAAGVAAGAAAADTVLTAIGGLSTWIDQQSNDTAVATLGSAFGTAPVFWMNAVNLVGISWLARR